MMDFRAKLLGRIGVISMSDDNTKLLTEIAALLREQIDERRKWLEESSKWLPAKPNFEKQREDMDRRMQEGKANAEVYRQELRTYQESVLLELRRISTFLEKISRRV
jgi:hypothetical protein